MLLTLCACTMDLFSFKVQKAKAVRSPSNYQNMPKAKVLYVEDELFLGKIVKESLESRDYEVLMETDGLRVMTAFKKLIPDVCVLDVMLPNKDGFSIAEEIR